MQKLCVLAVAPWGYAAPVATVAENARRGVWPTPTNIDSKHQRLGAPVPPLVG